MTAPIGVYAAVRSVVTIGGTAVVSMNGPLGGGLIVNPSTAVDQDLSVVETLYVSFVGDAELAASDATFAVEPGGFISIPANMTGNVSVNAASSGHKFGALIYQPSPERIYTGTFPPDGPTTLTKVIPSYLYVQYNDDEDLQAFVDSFNDLSQEYVSWFAEVGLPVFAGNAMVAGALLDWIGSGLYGYPRPVLPSGRNRNIGPVNTFYANQLPPNLLVVIGSQDVYATTDDVYKRCLTWHTWAGDGKTFAIKWLKRRVMRFLTGVDGGPGETDDTSRVSVSFSGDNQVDIRLTGGTTTIIGGALANVALPNTVGPNFLLTSFSPFPSFPLGPILKSAIDSGALELPFQFTYVVTVA